MSLSKESEKPKEPRWGRVPVDRIEAGAVAKMTNAARGVFIILTAHTRRDFTAWPSLSRIAKLTGMNERSVRRALQELEHLHVVRKTRQGGGRGRSGVYQFCTGNVDTQMSTFSDPKRGHTDTGNVDISDPKRGHLATLNVDTQMSTEQSIEQKEQEGTDAATPRFLPTATRGKKKIASKTDHERIAANWRALDRFGIKRNPRTARIAESEHVTAEWIGHAARSGPPVTASHMIVRIEDHLRDAEAAAADLAEQRERRNQRIAEAVSVEARQDAPPPRASAPAGTYENIRRQHRRALDWAASVPETEWLAIVGTIKGGTFTTDATDTRLLQSLRRSSDFCLTAWERFGATQTVRTADSADAAIAFNGEAANASNGQLHVSPA